MQFEHFIQIISRITHLPAESISPESNFRNDLEIDSLNLVNLFIQISEETGVGFEYFAGADDIETVGSFYKVVERGMKQ